MKRTNEEPEQNKIKIPDVINHTASKEYTQIPNDLLRNPDISGKAKALLALLLSNKEGWYSYIETIKSMMTEGESAIRTGLGELEQHGYLARVRYRDKKGKKVYRGSFWMYTDHPFLFHNLEKTERVLDEQGMCVEWPDYLHAENQEVDNQHIEDHRLKRLKNKKTKNKNINDSSENGGKPRKSFFGTPITPTHFSKFWSLYPKKAGKGAALTAWRKLCDKKPQNRPTTKQIGKAVAAQKESERWQNEQYIPHASTWLNQSRWLDDPKEMKSFSTNGHSKPVTGYFEEDYDFGEDDMNI